MNQTIRGFIKKELIQALRDMRMRALIFAVPAIQMTLFGFALSTEVRNVRLSVISKPGDVLASRVAQRCFASGWFIPAKGVEDPFEAVKSGRAEAVLIAKPKGFLHSFKRGEAEFQLLVDATNAVRARQVEAYVKAVVAAVAADARREAKPPVPLALDVRILYNPTMESSIFLVPAVMCLILCVVTIILTAMSLTREREIGTFETLISAPVSNWEIIAGKTLPYILLGMVDVPIILAVAMTLFGVPMKGHYWQLFAAALVFVCTTVSVGTIISSLAKTQQQSMMGGFLFLFPAILLSGMMFPVENIPEGFRFFSYLNPLMYFVRLLRNIMLKGGEPSVFWRNIAAMAAISGTLVSIAVGRFRQRLN